MVPVSHVGMASGIFSERLRTPVMSPMTSDHKVDENTHGNTSILQVENGVLVSLGGASLQEAATLIAETSG